MRFASVNNMLGHEVSRRDDLEALLYVAVWMFKQYAPWENVAKDCRNPFEQARLRGTVDQLV